MARSIRGRSVTARERAARRELATAQAELDRLTGDTPVRTRPRRMAVALAVLVVLAVAAAVAVGWRHSRDDFDDEDFRAAARTTVSALLLPDAGDPDRAQAILDASTGTFRDEFAQSTGAYRALVGRLGTVASGSVDGVAVADRAGDTAEVLVTAVVTTRTSSEPSTGAMAAQTPSGNRFRLRVRVEPDDGTLKLAAVEFLP